MSEERYNGWKNWDTWHVVLLMNNDEMLNRNYEAWGKNFAQKQARGNFDRKKAKYAVRKYIVPQALKEERKLRGGEFEPGEERIDPKKVDLDEIVDDLLQTGKTMRLFAHAGAPSGGK
jgi:hypothetical protein